MYGRDAAPAEAIEHGPLVAAIAAFLRPRRYVELGVDQGATLKLVAPHCVEAIGVDLVMPREPWTLPANAKLVIQDTQQFLAAQPAESIDLCFVDSSHEFEKTIREITLLREKLVENGIALVHDAYPPNEEQCAPGRCGEVWRALGAVSGVSVIFERCTLPAQYGLAILRKNHGRQLLWK